jgi:hypothetical protein
MARAEAIGKQVNDLLKEIRGIGESKLETRHNPRNSYKGESGHQISQKIHSYKYLDNARSTLANLGRFAKHELGIKHIRDIDRAALEKYIEHHIEKGNGYRHISNELSIINKVADRLSLDRDAVKEIREYARHEAPRPELASRSYRNLDKAEVHLKEHHLPAYQLQRDYGLRVKESTHINLDRQLDGNTLSVQGKGGKEITKELSPQMVQQLRSHANANGVYQVSRSSYSKDVRDAVTKEGNDWHGTHGIRHTYAQQELLNGKTKEEVSREMGHVRPDITNTYLR